MGQFFENLEQGYNVPSLEQDISYTQSAFADPGVMRGKSRGSLPPIKKLKAFSNAMKKVIRQQLQDEANLKQSCSEKQIHQSVESRPGPHFPPNGNSIDKELAGKFGEGVSVYFGILKMFIALFFLMGLASAPIIYINMSGNLNLNDSRIRVEKTMLLGFDAYAPSQLNNLPSQKRATLKRNVYLIVGCDALVCLIFVSLVLYSRWQLGKLLREIKERYPSVSRWAVQVEKIPNSITGEYELKKHFSQFTESVHECVLTRDYKGALKLFNQKLKLQSFLEHELKFQQTMSCIKNEEEQLLKSAQKIEHLQLRIQQKEKRIAQKIDKFLHQYDRMSIVGIVLFSNEVTRNTIRRKYNTRKDCLQNFFGCALQPKELRFRNLYPLKVSKAPDPSDIKWQNHNIPPLTVYIKKSRSALIGILLLIPGAWIVLHTYKNKFLHIDACTQKTYQ